MSGFDAVAACDLAEELAEAIRLETGRMADDAGPLAEVGRVRGEIAEDYAAAMQPVQDDPGLFEDVPADQRARLEAAVQDVRAAIADNHDAVRAQRGAVERILHNTLRAVDDDAQSAAYTEGGELRPRSGAHVAFALHDRC